MFAHSQLVFSVPSFHNFDTVALLRPVGVLISGSRHAAAPQLWGTSPTPEHALIQRWLTNTARHCKTGQNYKLCHHSCAQLCTFFWKASVDCFERH